MRIFGSAPDRGSDPETLADPWLAAIGRDFAATPAASMDVRVVDLDPDHPERLEGVVPNPFEWIDRSEPDRHRRLLLHGQGILALGIVESGSAVAPADAVEIASRLQDDVIDEWWRPWPEVVVGERTVVLEPRLGADGSPRWEGRDGSWCPFGELSAMLGDAPRGT